MTSRLGRAATLGDTACHVLVERHPRGVVHGRCLELVEPPLPHPGRPVGRIAATGIDPSLASFTLSLAPLAFAAFTALFAARSGVRAAEAGAGITGWLSGSLVFAAIASAWSSLVSPSSKFRIAVKPVPIAPR